MRQHISVEGSVMKGLSDSAPAFEAEYAAVVAVVEKRAIYRNGAPTRISV